MNIYTDPKYCADFPKNTDVIIPEENEDTIEARWIAQIIKESSGPGFTFAELGAGYGRWSVYTTIYARETRPDLDVFIIAAEPEPTHFKWLREHLVDNEVDISACELYNQPVTRQRICLFVTGHPAGWYGQTVLYGSKLPHLIPHLLRMRGIKLVRGITLVDVLVGHRVIDMVDMDIQGEELAVLESTPDTTLAKIRWLYIGTHSRDIEAGLRRFLSGKGWVCEQDIPLNPENGFTDGIQVWRNPG